MVPAESCWENPENRQESCSVLPCSPPPFPAQCLAHLKFSQLTTSHKSFWSQNGGKISALITDNSSPSHLAPTLLAVPSWRKQETWESGQESFPLWQALLLQFVCRRTSKGKGSGFYLTGDSRSNNNFVPSALETLTFLWLL